MNYYNIFYWLTVSDGVKRFFDVTSDIFTVITIFSGIVYIILAIGMAVDTDKTNKDIPSYTKLFKIYTGRLMYPALFLCLITWVGYVATPSKKDCILIVAGGAIGNFLTSDSSAKQIPADAARFLHVSLQNEIKSAGMDLKHDLGIQTAKEKFLDKAKNMSKEELINLIQGDTNLIK